MGAVCGLHFDMRSLRCPVVARHIGAVRGERCYEVPDALISPLFVGIGIVRRWHAKQPRGDIPDAGVQVRVRKAGKVRHTGFPFQCPKASAQSAVHLSDSMNAATMAGDVVHELAHGAGDPVRRERFGGRRLPNGKEAV
jgi:hypothetical protein